MPLFTVKKQNIPSTVLTDRYIVPPFSVFNTHQSYWKERTKMWLDMGIGGTNGRITSNNGLAYDNRRMDKYAGKGNFNGTSAFSPVVCEVVYKWFSLPQSRIFDPFAGGITRGVMASILNRNYTGVDINPSQIESNYIELQKLQERYNIQGSCNWICGDTDSLQIPDKYDLVFTCPPYYNLERYTENKNDLSNIETYQDFMIKYLQILEKCYNILDEDCFLVYVVSDVRNKGTTEYYGFVADTIKGGQDVGLKFYNEIILYNDTGNLAIVSGDYMDKARKVGRQHQNILVFYKGNPKHIRDKFGEV